MAGYSFSVGDTQFDIETSTLSIVDEQIKNFLKCDVSNKYPEGYLSVGNNSEPFPEDIINAIRNVAIEAFENGELSTSVPDLQYLINNVSIVGMWLKFLKNGQEKILAHILPDCEVQGIIDGSRYLTREETTIVSSVIHRVAENLAKSTAENNS